MTSFQKVLILVGLLQCEIAYGMWGISPWSCLMSPVTVVTNLPVISSGVEFGTLVANPETRETFVKKSVIPIVVPLAAGTFYVHRYLGGVSHEYANSSIAKVILFGGVALFAIRESVRHHKDECRDAKDDRRDKKLHELGQQVHVVDQRVVVVGQLVGAVGERVEGVGRQVADVHGVINGHVVPVLAGANVVLNDVRAQVGVMAPQVADTAAVANRLQRGQGFLALGVFSTLQASRQNSVLLDGIQSTQVQHGAGLVALGQQVGVAAEVAAGQHQLVAARLDAFGQGQAALQAGQVGLQRGLDALRETQNGANATVQRQLGQVLVVVQQLTTPAPVVPQANGINLPMFRQLRINRQMHNGAMAPGNGVPGNIPSNHEMLD